MAHDDGAQPAKTTTSYGLYAKVGCHLPDDPKVIDLFATVKPVVDGLVDGAIWPDDTPEWVTTLEPRLVVSRDRVVTVHIWPREVAS